MTLIAGFRCTDGAVICADSQETVGGRRVTVQKIEPIEIDKLQIVIAGSGENADLLEAFIEHLRQENKKKAITSIQEFKSETQNLLLRFMKDEASLYPRSERAMRFVIAARLIPELPADKKSKIVLGPGAAQIWETRSSRLVEFKKYALIGWDEELYHRAATRLFSAPLPISKAIPLAMYLFSLAEDTSNYVKGPVSVAVITASSPIAIEPPEAIEEFEAMTETYAKALEDMLLCCADTAISKDEFAEKFTRFSEGVFSLRRAYFRAVNDRETQGFFEGRWPGTPYQRLPRYTIRTLMKDGTIEAKEEREETERFKKQFQEFRDYVKKMNLEPEEPSVEPSFLESKE